MTQLLFNVLILTIASSISFGVELEEQYKWEYIDYVWKNSTHKQNAVKIGYYNVNKNVLYDADIAPDGRIFVTVVRQRGVPASLTTINKIVGRGGPLLSPYPNWTWHKFNKTNCGCDTITSVYRISIKCNRLFVLDCGAVGEEKICPPKLLIFNLENNMLEKCLVIPPDIASNKNGTGLLVTPLAHVRDCNYINDATVFMAGTEGYGLVIYNKNSGFYRIESDFMNDPTMEGQSFYSKDSSLSLTIINKYLYHASLAGRKIFKIDISNPQKFSKLSRNETNSLTKLVGTLSGQTGPIASAQHALFFSNIPETSILCTNTKKKFNTEIIAQDAEKLQFPSGMKVTWCGRKLLIVTNRLQHITLDLHNTLYLSEKTNFRILTMDIEQIRQETNCFSSCNSNDHSLALFSFIPWFPYIPWFPDVFIGK
ncbi:major royal jelly protein 1-like [Temnothorax nylanderi]|uniref:major royal jelly protein 1-like n=1 Tax=Temnothorax nylanderi TaxID=102681 RepID=UPI003A8697C4